MKIRMTQPEITAILLDAVLANLSLKSGSIPTIEFSATRGEDGIVAEIDVPYLGIGKLDLNARSEPKGDSDAGAVAGTSANVAAPGTEVAANAGDAAVAAQATATKPPRKPRAAKELFGDLTPATPPVQDPAAEQATAATTPTAADEAPFADAVDTQPVTAEAGVEASEEGAADEAETLPPAKTGKSLFD